MTLVPFDPLFKIMKGAEVKNRQRKATGEDLVHKKNISIIQDVYRSFREKDYAGFRSLCTPDVEWRQRKGSETVGENLFKDFARDWIQSGFRIDRFLTAENAVLVLGRYAGRSRARVTEESPGEAVHVYFLRDGKVTMFQQYDNARSLWDMASLS
jgi:ketosteroid isomerase-like protein